LGWVVNPQWTLMPPGRNAPVNHRRGGLSVAIVFLGFVG
jgi:hypothetical protein